MTGRLVVGIFYLEERRLLGEATIHPVRTTGEEATATISVCPQFLIVGQIDPLLPFLVRIGHRDGVDQLLHIRVLRVFDDSEGITPFSNGTLVEQVDFIPDLIGGA
jgi:hypothetical protein